jgi:hypothetical protein
MSGEEKLELSKAVVRDEGTKVVIEVPKPEDLDIKEIDEQHPTILAICQGCTGVITAAAHAIV